MERAEQAKEFPDVKEKLSAPKKLSAFEKERQAAAAKQQRAEEENAAALRAFEDSFGNQGGREDESFASYGGDSGPPPGPRSGYGYNGPRGGGYGGGPRSGPGSLGPDPGPPPPPSLKRKRALDEMRELQEARREMQDASDRGQQSSRSEVREEEEVEAPRPTVQLSSLPLDTTANQVEALLSKHASVYAVKFVAPSGGAMTSRRSLTAIATLEADVTSSNIEALITSLKDRYLGHGFYLKISRHLSSASMHPSIPDMRESSSAPFGAERPREERPRHSMRHAPPPDQRFAPPDSYDSRPSYGMQDQPDAAVAVSPPLTIEVIKAVHVIADRLLQEPNPERALQIEALLMASPAVQRDERFAFLFDPRSPAGIYYRYMLWAPEDESEAHRVAKRNAKAPERIFDDVPIDWFAPNPRLPFPDLKSLADAVADIDYDSSGEESDDEDGGEERQFYRGPDGEGDGLESKERKHITPMKRARLIYMLSRLPTSHARLRKGDVARVTNFAINNAGQGAEEIVDALLLNIEQPFVHSLAAEFEEEDPDMDGDDSYEPDEALVDINSPAPAVQPSDSKKDDDPSNATLIALYLISDILSASSTAGARNAWKYRSLFEAGFKAQRTFIYLGKIDKRLGWGRLKAEQWKRRISVILGMWESWSVFSPNVMEELKKNFCEPPLTEVERAEVEQREREEEARKREEQLMGRFKGVEQGGSSASASPAPQSLQPARDNGTSTDEIDGAPMSDDDIDGKPMSDDDDVDGKPMSDDDNIDGKPMLDDDDKPSAAATEAVAAEVPGRKMNGAEAIKASQTKINSPQPTAGPPKRMRAEDMFADSDEET